MSSNFRNLNQELKPREKFELYGGESLTDVELLAIVLQIGSKNKSVTVLSQELIERYGSLANLFNQPIYELKSNKGIGNAKAIKIKTIYHLTQKINKDTLDNYKVSSAKDIYQFLKVYENNQEENFYIVGLNNNNKILGIKHLFKGSIDSVSISFREIFKEAFIMDCKSICLVHNHPSGNLNPSNGDINMTKNIIIASEFIGINIIDHLVIGRGNYYSFKENGVIFEKINGFYYTF